MNALRLLCFTLFMGINCTISAQEIEWQNTIGGSSMDRMVSIQQTTDKGYICAGETSSGISGDKTDPGRGGNDFWIIRLDISGNIIWQKTIGGSGNEYLKEISQTLDGGYILGGISYSDSSGDKSENSQGLADFWILKLDSLGDIEWQNTIGGSGHDALNSVKQTLDGGYICGGLSNSDISGDKSENSRGGNDFWIIKLDATGDVTWQKTYGGVDEDNLYALQPNNDSGYICGGISNSTITGDKTEGCMGGFDYWILKLDSIGNILWQNTVGGNDDDILTAISISNTGNYFCVGHSFSNTSGDKNEDCFGAYDYWVLMIDTTGVLHWQNTIGGSADDNLGSIYRTNDGGCIVGGESESGMGGKKTEKNLGFSDFWIIKLDENGQIEWQNTIGGNSSDALYSIAQNADGSFILGGESISGISYDKSENIMGSSDFWVVKLIRDYNSITGSICYDSNMNNQVDSNETKVAFKKVIELNTSRFSFTDLDGKFNVLVSDSGYYEVAPVSINYFNNIPVNHFATFNTFQLIDSLNDFVFQPIGNFNDLCLSITPTGQFRSGFNASYVINYINQGTTSLNGTVIFYPDTNVNFVSANPSATTIFSDSVIFDIGNLSPFQIGQILVTVNVNLGLPIGTVINSGAKILPIAGDVNPICNVAYREVLTTGSADPNDILVSRNFLYDYEILGEPELEYIIRFQNTGNDTAFTVIVLNPVDTTRLQINTLEIVSSSHPMNASWITWERNMQFQFDNILLLDSNLNEPMSHGFVRYKIKPKANLLVGDSINNRAHIYFDFNNPVATNIAKTDIILFTGVYEIDNASRNFVLYPNPASTTLAIRFNQAQQKNSSLELYNVFGQKIRVIGSNLSGNNFIQTIDISDLSSGVYFLKLDRSGCSVKKFVKY